MAAETDLDRLDALLAQQEKAIGNAFREFIRTVGRDGPVLTAILDKLERGDVAGAMQIVDSYVASMGNVLPAVMHAVGAATATELAALIPDVKLAVSFDPSFPRAAEIIQANRLQFVTDFTEAQRLSTVQALARAYREGTGTLSTARAFRDSIGLTPYQENVVANYQTLLESGSRQALDRALRDRRFDPTIERAIEQSRPLTPKQIETMVGRYRARFLAYRAETIARTEGVRATSMAREESLSQMIDQTGISESRIDRIWNPIGDKRTREWHQSMKGQKRGRNEPFTDGLGNSLMYPGDPAAPAETVINCRCGTTFSVRPPA